MASDYFSPENVIALETGYLVLVDTLPEDGVYGENVWIMLRSNGDVYKINANGEPVKEGNIAAGVTGLGDLDDVDLTTVAPTDGQVLMWVAAQSLWKPGAGGGSLNYYEFAFGPTASDDGENTSGNGVFAKGDVWHDTVAGLVYMCTSIATDAAVWIVIGFLNFNGLTRQSTPVGTDQMLVDTASGYRRYLAHDVARLQFIREAITLSGAATDIDVSTALHKAITANADTTVDFTNIPASGNYWEMYWKVTQDATGGRVITITPTITWRGGEAPDFAGMLPNQVGRVWFWGDAGGAGTIYGDHDIYTYDEILEYAISPEDVDATTGTAKLTVRARFAFRLIEARFNAGPQGPTGAAAIFDINEAGATLFSTRPQIDAGEKTSTTAAVTQVVSAPEVADDAEITFDIDQVGSTLPGQGYKVALYVKRAT